MREIKKSQGHTSVEFSNETGGSINRKHTVKRRSVPRVINGGVVDLVCAGQGAIFQFSRNQRLLSVLFLHCSILQMCFLGPRAMK